MSSFSSDPGRRDDDQNDLGTPGGSSDQGASSPNPTGWERPSSDPSGDQPPSSGSSAVSSQSSAPDWPSYPPGTPPAPQPSGPEATRPFSAEQPPYQPYDPQSLPGYGGGTSAPYGSDPGSYNSGPYSSNPYGANPYGANPNEANPYENQPAQYGAYQPYTAPAQHPQAVTAFVLGLLGLVICPPIGIGGLVMGGRVRREIDASGGQVGGRGLATAGWVLGIISVVYFVVAAIFITFLVIAGQN